MTAADLPDTDLLCSMYEVIGVGKEGKVNKIRKRCGLAKSLPRLTLIANINTNLVDCGSKAGSI